LRRWWALILVAAVLFLGAGGCGENRSSHEPVPVVSAGQGPSESAGNDYQAADNAGLQVHFIDVGQGDSILVLAPGGEAMLVDGGDSEYGQTVVDYLQSQGIKKLTVLVATHPHADHIGGIQAVLEKFPVKLVYMPRVTNNTDQFAGLLTAIQAQGLKIRVARAGVDIPLSGVKAVFIAPNRQDYDNINDYSAVLKITCNKVSFLLEGDAGETSEAEMLASGLDLQADVLKVGHHGSHSSTSEGFLKAVAPQDAVIMCGLGNDYGHPHWETLESLSMAGVKTYRTDLNGNIVITTDGEKIDIKTQGNKAGVGGTVTRSTVSGQKVAVGGSLYIGNRNSHKFHLPTCGSLPKESNRVFFNNREQAITAGYSPCGRCQP